MLPLILEAICWRKSSAFANDGSLLLCFSLDCGSYHSVIVRVLVVEIRCANNGVGNESAVETMQNSTDITIMMDDDGIENFMLEKMDHSLYELARSAVVVDCSR